MSKRDDKVLLQDMLEHANDAIKFVGAMTLDEFCKDKKTKAAVTRSIRTIGEAASRVSEGTRLTIPAIPWKAMIGMRNILVHRYFDLDDEALWKVVIQDLVDLVPYLKIRI